MSEPTATITAAVLERLADSLDGGRPRAIVRCAGTDDVAGGRGTRRPGPARRDPGARR